MRHSRSSQGIVAAMAMILVPSVALGQANPLSNCKYYVTIQKDFERAGPYCEEAIKLYPEDPEARLFGAQCLAEQARYGEAWESYGWLIERKEDKKYKKFAETAEKQVANYYVKHFKAGVDFLNADVPDFESAAIEFRQANQINPRNVDALLNLGFTETRLGNLDAAIASFERALEQDPEKKEAYVYYWDALGQRLQQEREREALDAAVLAELRTKLRAVLEKVLTLEDTETSTVADAHLKIADLEFEAGNNDVALEHSKSAIELAPEAVVNLFNIAVGFYQASQYGPAIQASTIVLDNVPNPEDELWEKAKYVRALSYLYSEQFEPALADFEELIAHDGTNLDYLIKGAAAAANAGQGKKADDLAMRYEELKESQVLGE